MILKKEVSTLSRSELLYLNRFLKKTCQEIIGHTNPDIRTFNKDNNNFLGLYDPEYHRICIYRNNLKTINDYVKVFIHEWTHSLQKKLEKYYLAMEFKWGYRNNPFEVEARENEKIYKSIVWKIVKLRLREVNL